MCVCIIPQFELLIDTEKNQLPQEWIPNLDRSI